jgi:hypothetical protein
VACDAIMCTEGKETDNCDKIQCFDSQTEILTDNGWKKYNTILKTDKVLSLNIKTNVADYYPISKIFSYNYDGVAYQIKTNHDYNFIFTPNHRFLYKKFRDNKWILDKLTDKELNYNHYINFKDSFIWNKCDNMNVFNFKSIEKETHKKYNITISSDLWYEFLGWFISEGCLFEKRKDHQFSITQIKYRKEVKKLLNKINIPYWESNTEFLFCNKEIYHHLKTNCYIPGLQRGCLRKKIPSYIKNSSIRQIKIFLDAFNKGDGWHRKNSKEIGYCTTSSQLKDDLQELILKIGKGSNYTIQKRKHDLYSIFERVAKYRYIIPKQQIRKINYKGIMWDVETNPHHNVLIRRNGKIMWTGNSVQWISITVASILVGLGGGYIAEHYSYKLAYLLLIPIYFVIINIISKYKPVEQEYLVKDDIWKSRRWNKEHTDYIDLSGHSSVSLRRDKIYCIGKNAFFRQIYQNILSYKELFTNKQFLLACLFLFLYKYSPSFGTPLTFIERDIFGWSAQWMGILGAIVSCFEIIGAIVFYKFCKKINIKKWLYLSVWLGACTTLSYLHFTPITAIIYGIIYAIIGMGIHLIVMSWMAKSTLPGKEATSFALLCSINNLSAGTLSSFTGAILYPLIGLQWLIVLSAFTSFLCLPIIQHLNLSKSHE